MSKIADAFANVFDKLLSTVMIKNIQSKCNIGTGGRDRIDCMNADAV